MPTIAFWNLGKTSPVETVVEFIEENGIEILVVAEQGFEPATLIVAYARRTGRTLHAIYAPDVFETRIRFYSVFPINLFQLVTDDSHLSMREYRPYTGRSLLLVGVHLGSKMFLREADQSVEARRLMKRTEEIEALVGHERTIVLGDFNMNPFETGMVESDAMHGVMDRRIAAKLARKVGGESRRFFYNPMWRLMGDSGSAALGTYYRAGGSATDYFWHTFDQVLLRPSLLEHFREEELRIVQSVGQRSLMAKSGLGMNRKISDHLPIVCKLNT